MLFFTSFAQLPQTPKVYGLIAEGWHALGAEKGPLGNLVTEEEPTLDCNGRTQYFEYGTIVWSPQIGPKAMLVVYRSSQSVVFLWRDTDPFNYDKFIVRWTKNNKGIFYYYDNAEQTDIHPGSRVKSGIFVPDYNKLNNYLFLVEGADEDTFGGTAKQGWSCPIILKTHKCKPD